MKMLYTICSANHLSFAKTMADSFLVHNPDYKIIIGLADKINGRFDISYFHPHEIIELESMDIAEFKKMTEQYNVVEFNCALKPYLGKYLFKKYNPDILLYLDTDIYIYHSFRVIEEAFMESDILLTPHFTTPVNDGLRPMERGIINAGLYNAGFIGMKKSATTDLFLNWWGDRLKDQCYYNFTEGMGVDQTWLNFVPLFFDNTGLVKSKGANMAYWNMHERELSESEGSLIVNGIEPLLFFHISGYNIHEPNQLSKHQNRYSLESFPLLQRLFLDYRQRVIANNYEDFSKMTWSYAKQKLKGIKKVLHNLKLSEKK